MTTYLSHIEKTKNGRRQGDDTDEKRKRWSRTSKSRISETAVAMEIGEENDDYLKGVNNGGVHGEINGVHGKMDDLNGDKEPPFVTSLEESTLDKASSEDDEPTPRKPSIGKLSSKSRDTLTPLKEPSQEDGKNENMELGDDTEAQVVNGHHNNEQVNGHVTQNDSPLISERKSSLRDEEATSELDDRRSSYSSTKSNSVSETYMRRLSQRSSVDGSEGTGDESRPPLSRAATTDSPCASKMKAAWESRGQGDAKTQSPIKAVGGHTGTSSLKERFENSGKEPYQRSKFSRNMSTAGMNGDVEGEIVKKVSASSLKARFEQKALESAPSPGKRNFTINKGKSAADKFNRGPSNSSKCQVCNKSVYPMEKLECEGNLFHKFCFKCETCKRTLSLGTYASLEGHYYCKPHLKQLFQLKGNYDEGFGREQRKADWVKKDASPAKPAAKPKEEPKAPEPEPEPEPQVEAEEEAEVEEQEALEAEVEDAPVENGEEEATEEVNGADEEEDAAEESDE